MKRKITILACMVFLSFGTPLHAHASAFKELPAVKKSDQWYVKIDKAQNKQPGSLKPKKDAFDTYSLHVKNIGKDVKNATIEVYRNEPNPNTFYYLFDSTGSPLSNKTSFTHENLPVDVRATTIEIVIKWEEKQFDHAKYPEYAGREHKQTFVFNAQEQ